MLNSKIVPFLLTLCAAWLPLTSEAHGKIDFGPIYVNMKLLQNGNAVSTHDMWGVRGDATIQCFPESDYFRGIVVKPMLTWAQGQGSFISSGGSIGHYIPITTAFSFTPTVGGTYSRLRTHANFPAFGLEHLRQVTTASTVFVGLDLCYTLCETWMFSGSAQYGWAAGRTHLDVLGFSKGQSTGPACSLMVDYYLTKCWSVNAAWAYNHTLTHELHGTKASGVRIGMGYTY